MTDGVFHPHAFRHTFVTETLRTSNLRVAQEALDHKNISTTEIYTHVMDKSFMDVKSPLLNLAKNICPKSQW